MDSYNRKDSTSQTSDSSVDPSHSNNGRRTDNTEPWTKIDSAIDNGTATEVDFGAQKGVRKDGLSTTDRDEATEAFGSKSSSSESKIKSALGSIGVDPESDKVKTLLGKVAVRGSSDDSGVGADSSPSIQGSGSGVREDIDTAGGTTGRNRHGDDDDLDADDDFAKNDSGLGTEVQDRTRPEREEAGELDDTKSLGREDKDKTRKEVLPSGQQVDLSDEKGLGDY